MMKRHISAFAFAAAFTFLLPAHAGASGFETSTTVIRVGDASYYHSETSAEGARFAQVLSSHYGRPIQATEVIRLRADFDLGFGDISVVYAFAGYSGVPVDDLVVLCKKNLGWGEIAKMYGIKVKELKQMHDLFADSAHGHGFDITYLDIDISDDDQAVHKNGGHQGKSHSGGNERSKGKNK